MDGRNAGHDRATATILFAPCAGARLIVEVEKHLGSDKRFAHHLQVAC